jgi:hypothetical protein
MVRGRIEGLGRPGVKEARGRSSGVTGVQELQEFKTFGRKKRRILELILHGAELFGAQKAKQEAILQNEIRRFIL